MYQASLILEGGANRGIFTSGVLDYLMEQGFQVPYVVGVSAGACNAEEEPGPASWLRTRKRKS